jgi:hypothetical protein
MMITGFFFKLVRPGPMERPPMESVSSSLFMLPSSAFPLGVRVRNGRQQSLPWPQIQIKKGGNIRGEVAVYIYRCRGRIIHYLKKIRGKWGRKRRRTCSSRSIWVGLLVAAGSESTSLGTAVV